MMIVYVHPADIQGCGYYRLILASNVLIRAGHQVRIIPPKSRHGISGTTDNAGNLEDINVPPDADVMVFQRVTYNTIAGSFPLIRSRGVAVVVDMDDDLDRIDQRNAAFWALHPKTDTRHTTRTAAQACADATMVTVSTPALLKRYAPDGNGVVLPNYVPSEFFTVPRQDSTVVGWGGSIHSHPGDLQVMGDAAARLMREGHQFRVVGPPDGVRKALSLPQEPDTTWALPIDRWMLGLSTLGVGVAPLADTAFNQAKSRLKPLEYAAAGVPAVFSPRPDYSALHAESGIGVPAVKPRDWYRELKRLATDHPYRQEKSEADRTAAMQYTYEQHAWKWLQVWEEALKRQRTGSAVLRRTFQDRPQKAQV